MSNIFESLSDVQRSIVFDKKGRFVVRACPGSGKTYSVAARLARLIGEWGKKHQGIAAISFTNSAWQEIKLQLETHFGISTSINYPHFLGTIDSFINQNIFLPFGHLAQGCNKRPELVGEPYGHWYGRNYSENLFDNITFDINGNLMALDKLRMPNNWVSNQYISSAKQRLLGSGFAIQHDADYFAMKLLDKYPQIASALAYRYPLPELKYHVVNVKELTNDEIRKIAIDKIEQKIYSLPQQQMFAAEMIQEAKESYKAIVNEYIKNIIEIPRITIQQSSEVRSGFSDFDLDTGNLNYQPGTEQIIVVGLGGGKIEIIDASGVRVRYESIENMIVNELINYPEIDYDTNADLLFKLTRQAIVKFRTYLDEDKLINVVQHYKREIAQYIFTQMMQHFYCEAPAFEKPKFAPFTKIREHNYSFTKDSIHDYRETITPTSAIPSKLFSGFIKACHNLYKFDSKTEKDFARILEDDKEALKWLRPAPNQFDIYWNHNSSRYRPDFVVETKDTICLVETKKEGDIDSSDTQEKSAAALQYCKHATEFTTKNGGKPWKYVLIPHNAVQANMSFEFLVKAYEQTALIG